MMDTKCSFLCLVKINTPEGEQARLFEKSPFVIGREQNSDFMIAHSSISRKHLLVFFDASGVKIQDASSVNGTYCKDQKLSPQVDLLLQPDDQIRLGLCDQMLQFQIIPRPMELLSLSEQKSKLNSALQEVIQGLKSHAATQAMAELEQILQKQKESANLEILTLKETAEKEIASAKENLENEILTLKEKTNQEVQAAKEQSLADLEKQKSVLLQNAEEEIKKQSLESQHFAEKERQKLEEHLAKYKEQEITQILAEKNALETRKNELSAELENIQSQFQNYTLEAKLSAEKKIQEWLRETQARLQEDEKQAFEKQSQLQRETQEKIQIELKNGQKKADEFITHARLESEKMRDLAQADAQNIRKNALDQADKTILHAKEDAEKLIHEMTNTHEEKLNLKNIALIEKAKADCAKIAEETELKTKQAQQSIITKYQDEIRQNDKTLQELKQSLVQLQSQSQETSTQLSETKNELSALLPELKSKKSEFSTILQQVANAESIIKKSNEEKRNLEQYALQKIEQEEQMKAQKEKLMLDFDERKRQLEKELSKLTANHEEGLKKQIQAEELRLKELRKNQASEIARMIEIRIADRAKAYIHDANALSQFSQDLFAATRTVLTTDESSFQALTLHLNENKPDLLTQNKKYLKPAAISLVTAMILFGFIFRLELYSYFKSESSHSVAQQMMEQRKIQSVYNPEQTNEYRDSYMDNVLYYRHYTKIKSLPDYQQKWTLRLNDIALIRSLKITEDRVVQFQAIEANLVQKLSEMKTSIDAVYLSEGLEAMRKLEAEEVQRILELLKGQSNYDKIRTLEKEFLQAYQEAHKAELTD